MHFARLVKEYYEAPVFPTPISIVEKLVNELMECYYGAAERTR
jgi:hypothetical protein